jgi:hypothetical protein
MVSAMAEQLIRSEYAALCRLLSLSAVTLDIYDFVEGSTATTIAGSQIGDPNARYSAQRKLLALPICEADDLPSEETAFPPTEWHKASTQWPAWRIELWHEVVHQQSDELGLFNPKEPGRTRADGSTSDMGHGRRWWSAVQKVAQRCGALPDDLDTLVDR